MESILDNINLILDFILTAFGSIFGFINSNPLIGISVYIPLVFLLITMVFGLITSILNRKD